MVVEPVWSKVTHELVPRGIKKKVNLVSFMKEVNVVGF